MAGGVFLDNVGWLGSSFNEYPVTAKLDFAFDYNPVTGYITRRQMSNGTSQSTVGPASFDLQAQVANGDPDIDQTMHTVTMQVGGGVGVGGTYSVGPAVPLSYGFSLSFSADYSWGTHIGIKQTTVKLQLVKGADN